MKTKGVYYIPKADKIVLIRKCEYYGKDITPTPASLVTWVDDNGEFPKTLVSAKHFKSFVRLGAP